MGFLRSGENSSAIVKVKPTVMELKSRDTDLIQPENSSGKIVSIGAIAFTAFVLCNFAAIPAVVPLSVLALGAILSKQIPTAQTTERKDELNLILNAGTAKHPSINDLKSEFEKQNLSHQVNEVIEEMMFNCQYIDFPKGCNHVLAGFNDVYCYVEEDQNGRITLEMLPLHYVYRRLKEWGFSFIAPKDALETPIIATAFIDQQLPGIGYQTRLNAVDVSGSPVDAALLPVEQIRAMPLAVRADYIIEKLAESGFDVRHLINRPTLACGGLQRSGKSTLIILLSLLEMAKGQEVVYISRDNDLPPIQFSRAFTGSIQTAVAAFNQLNDRIQKAAMGSLSGKTFILDEFLASIQEVDKPIRDQLWSMVLTGFAKQGARVRLITHAKTATANMLPSGMSETFKHEVKLLWTDRIDDEQGYRPSGRYTVMEVVDGFYRETTNVLEIPSWLLVETNPAWHNAPCPVRSLLVYFPEFAINSFEPTVYDSVLSVKKALDSVRLPTSNDVQVNAGVELQPDQKELSFDEAINWLESQLEPEEVTVNSTVEDNDIVDVKVLKALERIVLLAPTDRVTIASVVKAVEGNSKKRPELIQHVLEHIRSCKPEWTIEATDTHNGTSYSVRLAN